MKFILNQGEHLQLQINNWLKSNKYSPDCYHINFGETTLFDASMIKQYYIRRADIINACSTTQNLGNRFYIETIQGYVHEFTGTVTTIGLLNAEFNAALRSRPS